jgi:L-iditol 2-dehydrogenase
MPAAVTSRVAVLHAPGDVRLEERPRPAPGSREVLVEVTAVGVCGSDVHYYEDGRIGARVVRAPLVLGHEAAGRIVEVGAAVTRHAVGDRVAVEPGMPCSACRECRAGRYNLCADVRFFGSPPVDGAFAQHVVVHEDFAFALPDDMPDEVGALAEPLSVAIWACRKAGLGVGSRVVVTGAGPIGLLALQVARAAGAVDVFVTDVDERRLRLARELGATAVGGAAPAGFEADALLECSGNEQALAAGIEALRPAGTAVVVGMGPVATARLPMATIQRREIWLTATFRYAGTYPAAIDLLARGRVDVGPLITGRYGLDDVDDALTAGRRDPRAVKTMVIPNRGDAT